MASNSESVTGTDQSIQILSYLPGSDQSYVDVLQQCFGPEWGDLTRWQTKHIRRTNFNPNDAMLCRAGDVPAACFHTASVSLVLEPGLNVPANFEGDYAVIANFRRRGMVEQAHVVMGREIYERGAVFRCGFTSGELHARVYSKKFCHVFVPTVTTTYRKILSSTLLSEKILAYADAMRKSAVAKRILRNKELTVVLRIPRYDPCIIALTQDSVTLMPSLNAPADVEVAISYSALAAAKSSGRSMLLALAKCLFKGELRTKGTLQLLRRLL